MKKSRFAEEQIVSILRETDWDTMRVVAKRQGVSEQSMQRSETAIAITTSERRNLIEVG
jgi:hypothetical protein